MKQYQKLTKEELQNLVDSEPCINWATPFLQNGLCDRKSHLFYLPSDEIFTCLPVPLAHLIVEDYMSRPYEDVDWQRATSKYDLNAIHEIEYIWTHPLVWMTPNEFTLMADRFYVQATTASERADSDRLYSWDIRNWKKQIMKDAAIYFADNLPSWNYEDETGAINSYALDGMIQWDCIMTELSYSLDNRKIEMKRNIFSISKFRENIKLIAKYLGGAKAALIIRKFQEDWPYIEHWGCFGINDISEDDRKFFKKSLFEGFNRELKEWEKEPEVLQQTSDTNDSSSILKSDMLSLPIPRKGKYNEVRLYIEKRQKEDSEFKYFCKTHNRKELCEYLSPIFGWVVDDHALGTNINRH